MEDRKVLFHKDAHYKNPKLVKNVENIIANFKKVKGSEQFTDEEIRDIFSNRWYHQIDLGNGFVTQGVYDMDSYLSFYEIPDLNDKRAIDVGASEGVFSFAMESMGAKEVVACELFAHVIKKMSFVKKLKSSNIQIEQMDVLSSDFSSLGQFDVVMCSHVLQHVGVGHNVNDGEKESVLDLCWDLCNENGKIIIAVDNKADVKMIQEKFSNLYEQIADFKMRDVHSTIFHITKSTQQ